jgi:hypothetical protein
VILLVSIRHVAHAGGCASSNRSPLGLVLRLLTRAPQSLIQKVANEQRVISNAVMPGHDGKRLIFKLLGTENAGCFFGQALRSKSPAIFLCAASTDT